MTAFSTGPAWPADLTEETNDPGEICEKRHRDLLAQVAQRLGTIIAGGDSYELTWFLQALFAISKLAAEMADAEVEENSKKH